MPAKQYRGFIGTLNNPDVHYPDVTYEDYLMEWHKQGAVFVTGQLEKGDEGTLHLQYYLHYTAKRTLVSLKTHCKHSHFQPVVINNGADAYCNKEETRQQGPWHFGIRPARNNVKGDKKRRTEELLQKGPEKALEEGDVSLGRQYLDLVAATSMYKLRKQEALAADGVRGQWLYGPPGTGKSHTARERFPDAYIKAQNKWWDGYDGQKAVILDDLDTNTLGHYLKIWTDKYPCTGEIKKGTVPLMHEHFVVTSNKSIEELFEDKVMAEAIRRRCYVHHFTVKRPESSVEDQQRKCIFASTTLNQSADSQN